MSTDFEDYKKRYAAPDPFSAYRQKYGAPPAPTIDTSAGNAAAASADATAPAGPDRSEPKLTLPSDLDTTGPRFIRRDPNAPVTLTQEGAAAFQGATFGLGDELAGAAAAAGVLLTGHPGAMADAYNLTRQAVADPAVQLATNHPWVAGAVQLPGAALTGKFLPTPVPAASVAGRIGQALGYGTAMGAAAGAASAEPGSRGIGAATGAIVGGGLGGGLTAAGEGVRRLLQTGVAQRLAPGMAAAATAHSADDVVAGALRQDDRTLAQGMDARGVPSPGSPAPTTGQDQLGRAGNILALKIAAQGGEPADRLVTAAQGTIDAHAADVAAAPGRVSALFRRALGGKPQDAVLAAREHAAQATIKSQPLYEAMEQSDARLPLDEKGSRTGMTGAQLLASDPVRDAYAAASKVEGWVNRKLVKIYGNAPPDPDAIEIQLSDPFGTPASESGAAKSVIAAPDGRTLDFIKKGLDLITEGGPNGEELAGKSYPRSVVKQIKNDLLDLSRPAMPEYTAARDMFGGEKGMENAAVQGKTWAKKGVSAEQMKSELSELEAGSQAEADQARLAYAGEVSKDIGGKVGSAGARPLSMQQRQKLDVVLPGGSSRYAAGVDAEAARVKPSPAVQMAQRVQSAAQLPGVDSDPALARAAIEGAVGMDKRGMFNAIKGAVMPVGRDVRPAGRGQVVDFLTAQGPDLAARSAATLARRDDLRRAIAGALMVGRVAAGAIQ